MRLSEAIRLGSLVITARAKTILSDDATAGCAIGMGLVAIGQTDGQCEAWPWAFNERVVLPCECCQGLGWHSPFSAIGTSFDRHVMGDGTMTLEGLCDQVRAWEDELAAKGINVEQVTLIATPEATHEPAAEHTEKVSV